jgi:hypothetical protein
MIVSEVGTLFRQWADEGDETFLTKADVGTYLKLGYRRFRQVVRRIVPTFYNASVDITLASSNNYNLQTGAVKILGVLDAALTHSRLSSLIKVETVDASGNWLDNWSGAQGWGELRTHAHSYLLDGVNLTFSRDVDATIRLRYVPVDGVNWTLNEPTDADTFIDDCAEHHALIATYAYGFYAPRDFADNPFILQLQGQQEKDMRGWLYGRVAEQSDHVAIDP